MEIIKVCLLISCLVLNIGHSVPQINFGGSLAGVNVVKREFIIFTTGDFNNFNSGNSFRPAHQQNQQQPSSGNCNQFFSYHSDDNGLYGVIKIVRPDKRTSEIIVTLSVAAQLSSQNSASVSLSKCDQDTISDILQGSLFYRVNFPIQNPVPQITEIRYNDQLLCSAPKVTGSSVATIIMPYSFTVSQTSSSAQEYVPQKPAVRTTTRTTLKSRTLPPPVELPAGYDVDLECGVPDYKEPTSTALVVNGLEIKRGQFPWLAALYYNPQNDGSGFICGGSLVSRKLVVTAAHCIQSKESNDASRKKAEDIMFHLGKRNLQSPETEQDHVISGVQKVRIHPDWDKTQNYDADIAIAVLSRTIIFNKFVKPICLWTSTQSFDDIIGVKGVVAGWGVDESKTVTTKGPKWARIPVVTSEVCLRSHFDFRTLTSDRTFCAGDTLSNRVGGSGPCNGDSGGGFIVKNGNKWYLRGIISAAIVDPETQTCNPENFSVFTDVAKFTSWIQNYMTQYG